MGFALTFKLEAAAMLTIAQKFKTVIPAELRELPEVEYVVFYPFITTILYSSKFPSDETVG
jgi:hypothetical protein